MTDKLALYPPEMEEKGQTVSRGSAGAVDRAEIKSLGALLQQAKIEANRGRW
jgi:hypothetical protein